MKTLDIIEGELINLDNDGCIIFKAKAYIDSDGSGSSHGDKYYQPDTSLHLDGKPLNSDIDLYIVLPPQICDRVAPIVLGCAAIVTNTLNGNSTAAVVGDIGPHRKIGEISIACAKALGIPSSPVTGGEDRHVIHYKVYPGQAAIVNGKQYKLQARKG